MLSAALFAGCAGCKGGTQTEMKKQYDQAFYGTTASVDGKSFSPVSGYDGKKYVGMFYCLWNGDANETIPDDKTVYDVSRYEAENRIADTVYGGATPSGPAFHYWGEPLYGYYRSEDPWVIRRHLELFLHAGIDFLCFDTSNALIYEPRVRALLEVWQEYEALGYNVPKLMFMTNTDSEETVKKIYDAFYREGKYDGLWFRGEGNRPWILGVQPKDAPYRDAFYFKRAQWPNDPAGIDPDKFPWISWSYPQEKHSDAQLGTIMSVSVAQHVGLAAKGNGVSADFSDSALCSPANRDSLPQALAARVGSFDKIYNANWGRGYSHKDAAPHNDASRIPSAVNFEEQFETALDGNAGVDCIFVLGWNEWVAQKQPGSSVFGDGVNHFVDLFNMEFSRDIEPMRGGYEDRYPDISHPQRARLQGKFGGRRRRAGGRKDVRHVRRRLAGACGGLQRFCRRYGEPKLRGRRPLADSDRCLGAERHRADSGVRRRGKYMAAGGNRGRDHRARRRTLDECVFGHGRRLERIGIRDQPQSGRDKVLHPQDRTDGFGLAVRRYGQMRGGARFRQNDDRQGQKIGYRHRGRIRASIQSDG